MSCFIIEDKSINKIVDFFIECAYSKEEFKPEITRIINSYGYDLTHNSDDENPNANKLGLQMKKLNLMAYNDCYKNKLDGVFDESVKFKFDYDTKRENNLIQMLKHIQCFIYQCSEGDYTEDKFYLTFVKIEKVLIGYIISHLDDYKKAKWE